MFCLCAVTENELRVLSHALTMALDCWTPPEEVWFERDWIKSQEETCTIVALGKMLGDHGQTAEHRQ